MFDDSACATCGYSLRGLSPDALCPECGNALRLEAMPMEHRRLAELAIALAAAKPFIAIAPQFLLPRAQNNSIEMGATVLGFAVEIASIVVAVISSKRNGSRLTPGRGFSTLALSVAIPVVLGLGCCGGIGIAFLTGLLD